jgi:hypothetical protein
VKENVIFGKQLIIDRSRYQVLNRNWIENNSKRIDCVLEFKIAELLTYILGKTGTKRYNS